VTWTCGTSLKEEGVRAILGRGSPLGFHQRIGIDIMSFSRLSRMGSAIAAALLLSACAARRPEALVAPLPVSPTPVWRLETGDQVKVKFYREPELTTDATVNRNGDVYFAGLGRVHVAGLMLDSLQTDLQARYERLVLEPTLDVSMSRDIVFYGQVRTPGTVVADQALTVLGALAKAGGSTALERDPTIWLVKANRRTYALAGDARLSSIDLEHGDAIFVQGQGFLSRNQQNLALVGTMSQLLMTSVSFIFTVLK